MVQPEKTALTNYATTVMSNFIWFDNIPQRKKKNWSTFHIENKLPIVAFSYFHPPTLGPNVEASLIRESDFKWGL